MDFKIFWLITFIFIGIVGSILTFGRRYKNPDDKAGKGTAAGTLILLFYWLLAFVCVFYK
jgi:heme/copper-type cytochrome/quinol oxidase subunit 2